VVDDIEKIMKSEWNTKIQTDTGIFYFHWTTKVSPFFNKCLKKNEYEKKNDGDRESGQNP